MKVRNALALAAAVPALVVALAAPGAAASANVVAFAGQITVRPTVLAQQQTLDVCFLTAQASCANGAESSGMAAGPAVDAAGVDAVDGLQARATYVEQCAPATAVQPIGSATLTGRVHKAVSGSWGPEVRATWFRAGLVAVIQGDGVVGAALFTPLDAPACGRAVPVAVAGAVELAY